MWLRAVMTPQPPFAWQRLDIDRDEQARSQHRYLIPSLTHQADPQMRSGVRRSTGLAPTLWRTTSRQRGAHAGPWWCATNRATATFIRSASTPPTSSTPQAQPSWMVSRMGARASTAHGIPGAVRLRQQQASRGPCTVETRAYRYRAALMRAPRLRNQPRGRYM